MPPDEPVALRAMAAADLPAAAALTTSFGWPHRREDWAFMLGLGEGVAAERDGRLVGTALCWRFGRDAAALGLIAVDAALHGQGIGRRMVLSLLEGLRGRSTVLHATEAGMQLYASRGFVPAARVVQLQGVAALPPHPADPAVRPLVEDDRPALLALDRAAAGMDRSALLDALLPLSEGTVLLRGGAVAGFALRRLFGRGSLVGPVVAPDEEGARTLIASLLPREPGRFVRLDVPGESGLPIWLAGLGLADAGTVRRMVLDARPGVAASPKVFGLASQAFG